MKIEGYSIDLVELTEEDLELIREWRNSNIKSFFIQKPISPEEQKLWFKRIKEIGDYFFLISLKDGKKIGTISLYNIFPKKSAELGRMFLIPEYRGEGYAEQAIKLLIDLAIKLELKELKLTAYKGSIEAIQLYTKVGFRKVGDVIVMTLNLEGKRNESNTAI